MMRLNLLPWRERQRPRYRRHAQAQLTPLLRPARLPAIEGGAVRLDTQQRRALMTALRQHATQGNAVNLHGLQLQPGLLDDGFKWRQRTLPTRSHHHLGATWLVTGAPHDLKIQGQVFQRKWE